MLQRFYVLGRAGFATALALSLIVVLAGCTGVGEVTAAAPQAVETSGDVAQVAETTPVTPSQPTATSATTPVTDGGPTVQVGDFTVELPREFVKVEGGDESTPMYGTLVTPRGSTVPEWTSRVQFIPTTTSPDQVNWSKALMRCGAGEYANYVRSVPVAIGAATYFQDTYECPRKTWVRSFWLFDGLEAIYTYNPETMILSEEEFSDILMYAVSPA